MPRLKQRRAVSARVAEEITRELQAIARAEGRTVSQVLARLADQGIRMRRFPGIVFIEGPRGRRAHLAGTGFDVWEIVALYRAYGEDAPRLLSDHPALERRELELAIAYAQAYRDEIDQLIAENEQQIRMPARV
jgi:uncharacterized protein (DUF433 family)